MTEACYIVYLCFGEEQFFYECAFSLMSISRFYPGGLPTHCQIVVYTDNTNWFEKISDCPLAISYCTVDKEQMDKWQGDINYLYRTKVEMLQHFCSQHYGNVLYMDTDIVLTFPLEQLWQGIAGGNVYMHQPEGTVKSGQSPVLRKLDKYFKKIGLTLPEGDPASNMVTWNSGIIGLHTDHKELIDQTLHFIDDHYLASGNIRTIEQIAFAYVMSKGRFIKSGLPYFLHYWNLREISRMIAAMWTQIKSATWAEKVEIGAQLQPYALMLDRQRFDYNRTLSDYMQKKKWADTEVEWDKIRRQI